jgi:hypothetical protein
MTSRVFLLIAACLLISSSLAADSKNATVPTAAEAEKQLLDLERQWTAAEDKHDAAFLRGVLDDKFLAVGANKTYDTEAFIKLEAGGEPDPTQSQTVTHEAVIVDGDTAVVVGTDTGRGTENGAAYTAVFKYTVTYIHRRGRWVALAEHIVRVPSAK